MTDVKKELAKELIAASDAVWEKKFDVLDTEIKRVATRLDVFIREASAAQNKRSRKDQPVAAGKAATRGKKRKGD